MRDTLFDLCEDSYKCDDSDLKLVVPVLQIAMWPNVCCFSDGFYKMVKNQRTVLKVHPGSVVYKQKCRLVLFNEQLIT